MKGHTKTNLKKSRYNQHNNKEKNYKLELPELQLKLRVDIFLNF